MKKQLLTVLCLLSFSLVNAQTFTNPTTIAIPDNNTYIYDSINVTGIPTSLNTTTFGLESVTINVSHPNDADLRMKLRSPTGVIWVLTNFFGGTGDNYTNTIFTDTASTLLSAGTAPFTGYFRSVDPLVSFNNGQNGNGKWELMVRDQTVGNVGSIVSWSIKFSTNPMGSISFTSSNLPIVIVNTIGNASIPNEPKLGAWMGIIYNGPGVRNYLTDSHNYYNDSIGIEVRGSSSAGFPQQQYGLETRDITGLVHDTMVLGMPAEHDWILYAPYDDKTCMRNVLSYDIANKTGHYASRTVYCELVLNGDYHGIYTMMEKVKRDSNRVSIAKLDSNDVAGDSLTGGYIIKIDKLTGSSGSAGWNSNYLSSSGANVYIQYDYPNDINIQPAQKTYIQNYVDSFETALSGPNFADTAIGYRHFIGVGSFIDYFILDEISKNVDGYRLSTYLHKDKYSHGGGKLKMGPAWDYNLAFWNANYCQGDLSTGWEYQFNNVCGGDSWQNPFWWERLLQDPNYANELKCRWLQLRQTTLSLASLNNYIDSTAAYLNEAQARHFQRWPILGVYTWPNPSPLATTYAGEITNMKNWIAARLTWMDANMPGVCGAPVANLSAAITSVCAGDSISFSNLSTGDYTTHLWTFAGGTPPTSIHNNPTVTYNSAGTFDVSLIETNAGGADTVSMSNYVTINPLPVITVDSFAICPGASASLTANGGTSYSWSAGATVTGVNTASVSPATNTTYTVTGTASGCSATAVSEVIINPLPSVTNASSGISICSGDTVNFSPISDIAGSSFNWTNSAADAGITGMTASGTGNISEILSNSNPLPGTATYIIIPTSGAPASCVGNQATLVITVNPPVPVPTITQSGIVLTSSDSTGNQWYLNGVIIPGATSQNYTVTANGNYSVISTIGGCVSDTSSSYNFLTIGINQTHSDNTMMIYPNPSNGLFTLDISGFKSKTATVKVMNVLSQIVFESEVHTSKTEISLNSQTPGVYFIQVITENGKYNAKLMKE